MLKRLTEDAESRLRVSPGAPFGCAEKLDRRWNAPGRSNRPARADQALRLRPSRGGQLQRPEASATDRPQRIALVGSPRLVRAAPAPPRALASRAKHAPALSAPGASVRGKALSDPGAGDDPFWAKAGALTVGAIVSSAPPELGDEQAVGVCWNVAVWLALRGHRLLQSSPEEQCRRRGLADSCLSLKRGAAVPQQQACQRARSSVLGLSHRGCPDRRGTLAAASR